MNTGNNACQFPGESLANRASRAAGVARTAALTAVTVTIGVAMTVSPATASTATTPEVVPMGAVNHSAGMPHSGGTSPAQYVGSTDNPIAIPPELLPQSLDVAQAPPVDPIAAGIIVADYLGDASTRDGLLNQLPEQRREAVAAVLSAIHEPIAAPDYSDPSTHLTILGGGVHADGTLPPKVVQRMEAGLTEANAHPAVPVLVTGGDTGNGVTEASSMRQWLLDNGVADERIITEDRSWTTLSNAAESHRLLPDVTSLVLVTSESHLRRAIVDFTAAFGPDVTVTGVAAPENPAGPDAEEQRSDIYRDALLWHLLPESIIVDGVPPIAGPGVARIW